MSLWEFRLPGGRALPKESSKLILREALYAPRKRPNCITLGMGSVTFHKYTVYLHVYADGKMFIHPHGFPYGFSGDFDALRREISLIKEHDGVLLYSIDNADQTPDEVIVPLAELLTNEEIEFELIQPQPEVHGFQRSYEPALEQAMQLAESDLKGLEDYFEYLGKALLAIPQESPAYGPTRSAYEITKRRLEHAREAKQKLSSIHFDLCVEPQGFH